MKALQYRELVDHRRGCRACKGLINPAVACGGKFDPDGIGPWSDWHGDLDAPIMVVGQDWGDTTYFEDNGGIDNPKNPTNLALARLLASIGYPIGTSTAHIAAAPVFLSNAILCLKSGGLQGPVERRWFDNCGARFLRPLIELIAPLVVVCLGERSYKATLGAFAMRAGPFKGEVESVDGTLLFGRTRAFAVYHCGLRIQNTHRPLALQHLDWARMRTHLAAANPDV